MKWALERGMGVLRAAAIWVIRTRIDPEAEFYFFEKGRVVEEAKRIGAKSIHAKGGDFYTHDGRDTVRDLLDHYKLGGVDPALDLWSEMVRDASIAVRKGLPAHPESFGVYALLQGYIVSIPNESQGNETLVLMFAALYEWARKVVAKDIVPPRALTLAVPASSGDIGDRSPIDR